MKKGFFKTALMAAVGALVGWADDAQAGLQFQSDAPTYSASDDGSTKATVKLYLVETEGTNTITSQGGLNSVSFKVVPTSPPANPVQLFSIAHNPAYTGGITPNLAAGSLYEEMPSTVGGIAAETTGKYYLGTFVYSGAGAANTTFAISARGGSIADIWTATGTTPIDSSTTPSTFTINVVPVPEPSMAFGAVMAAGLLALRRRRSIAA